MRLLREEFPSPLQPKQVAAYTRVSHANAKKWLNRNTGHHVVLVAEPGWYRAMADHRLLKRIGLEPYQVHALQVTIKSPNGGPPPALRGLGTTHQTRDGQEVRKAEFKGRAVTVQAGGLVSVRASTAPLDVQEFMELSAWLDGLAGGGDVQIVSMDLNVDVDDHRLKMSGVQSMSLGPFANALWKVYNKQVVQATRIEACVHRVDLSMQEAARILQEFSAPSYMPEWNPPPHPWEAA